MQKSLLHLLSKPSCPTKAHPHTHTHHASGRLPSSSCLFPLSKNSIPQIPTASRRVDPQYDEPAKTLSAASGLLLAASGNHVCVPLGVVVPAPSLQTPQPQTQRANAPLRKAYLGQLMTHTPSSRSCLPPDAAKWALHAAQTISRCGCQVGRKTCRNVSSAGSIGS